MVRSRLWFPPPAYDAARPQSLGIWSRPIPRADAGKDPLYFSGGRVAKQKLLCLLSYLLQQQQQQLAPRNIRYIRVALAAPLPDWPELAEPDNGWAVELRAGSIDDAARGMRK